MQHTVKYVNGKGDVIDFTAPLMNEDGSINPYRLITADFMNYSREYNSADDYRLRGGKITAFKRSITEYEVELDVLAATEELYMQAINDLHDIAEYDVEAEEPGKLYVNGSYLKCYIIASKKEDWESPVLFLSVTLTVVAERPVWWREDPYEFAVVETEVDDTQPDEFVLAEDTDSTQVDFPFEWAFDPPTTRKIDNTSAYQGSDFILRIYGPISSPSIAIDGVNYNVDVDILSQEMVEINSYERTVVKRNTISGTEVNVFGSRGDTVFEQISAGWVTVSYSGSFAFDLILLMKRSEPLWIS